MSTNKNNTHIGKIVLCSLSNVYAEKEIDDSIYVVFSHNKTSFIQIG